MHLTNILDDSAATSEFKAAVLSVRERVRSPLVTSARPVPHVKIVRLLTHLLDAERELEIASVRIHADSGCSDLTGVIDVVCGDGMRRFSFAWDCAWRASELGWTDCFGFPDQMRAAREYDWRCFKSWQAVDEIPTERFATA
ncbi:MAG TPA: hypothetical protein VGO46_04910 [Gemmatimonadaceae bacterium]|jgi:hypothetical protein|nr:hypothetical protein [Gemmatimonadaceae bacterium]